MIFAAEESHIKSVRARDIQSKLVSEKCRPGSRAPIGYDFLKGILIPNNDRKVVNLIYFLACWGNSQKTIADFLNQAKITTKNIKSWSSSSIRYILHNPVYTGVIEWKIRGKNDSQKGEKTFSFQSHDAVISPTMIQLNKQAEEFKKAYVKLNTPYFFRGILKCEKCNEYLIAKDYSPKIKKKSTLYINVKGVML